MYLARKSIDAGALVHNYRYLKSHCADAGVLAVVKTDAYGHGLEKIATALKGEADGFAVAVVAEGIRLRELGIGGTVLVMQGAADAEELRAAAERRLALVVHSFEQLALLERHGVKGPALWLKFNTGMGRLGFPAEAVDEVLARVERLNGASLQPVLMSHLAYADEPGMKDADEAQRRAFERLCKGRRLKTSLENSAGALCGVRQSNWVRIGIALYGAPPACAAPEHRGRLKTVMTVTAPLIAIRECQAGERVGYGGTHACPRDTKIGIVGIGYGDGYPRAARDGTPVWLGGARRGLAGRVSMDMIAVDLGKDSSLAVGDVAELWGRNLPAAEVAEHCGTISYELLTAARGLRDVP